MASQAAVLLDQLMGMTRNAVPGDNTKELSWSDEEVCKYYLCGFCPSELFVNTKAEAAIGSCYKVHDERLKKSYEECSDRGRCGYENMFLSYLERLIRDLDKKVERGKDRLRRSAQAKQQSLHGDGPGGCSSEKLKQLNLDIEEMVKELQLLGELGRVEEAQELMNKLEQLEKERETERLTLTNTGPKVLAGFELDSNDFHEKMELCDVCGSFLVIGDTQSRVDAHLLGKQHIGFARIRTTIADLKSKKEDQFRARQEEISQQRKHQEQDDSSSHHKHRHRSRSRNRKLSNRSNSPRDKYRRGSSPRGTRSDRRRKYSGRSRSHSRDKRRSHSRSRDKKRSRSHSRDKRRSHSYSRDKRGAHSRDKRRSRSHSRGRRSRSHSRDRRRARSPSRDKRSRNRKRSHSRSRSRERKRSLSKSRCSPKSKDDTSLERNGDKNKDDEQTVTVTE